MLSNQTEYWEHDWPMECRFIWDRPLSSAELGGLSATRGFWYQYLYVIRLMDALLNGSYDGYACEWIEDFLLWKRGPTGNISKLSLVQVKTSTNKCFLKKTAQVKKVLLNFTRAVESIASESPAEISCQLIYNDYHDCDCDKRIQTWGEYRELNERLRSLNDASNKGIEFQRYLPVSLSSQAIIAELEFFKAEYIDLYRFLTSPDNLEVFLRSLLGLIFPFHSARAGSSFAEPARRGEFPLWKLHHTRSDVVRELQQVLESAMQRVRRAGTRGRINRRIDAAKKAAYDNLHAALGVEQSTEDTFSRRYDTNQCEHALVLANMLEEVNESFLLQPGRFEVSKLAGGWRFKLERNFSRGLIPLYRYLARQTSSHLDRIYLILSFARALSEFSQRGVVLRDFRANDPTFRDLYWVEKAETGQPRIVLGDFSALSFVDENGGLLDQHWCRGSVLGKALRYLYYGTPHKTYTRQTSRYKATWNDNVVSELANWLEVVKNYIEPTELETIVLNLFEDEFNKWPLVITAVDKKFISDIAYNGIDSVASALCGSYKKILEDRGPWQQHVYYALTETEQIGLLFEYYDEVCLYRYIPYFTQRWERARRRDRAMAVPLIGDYPRVDVSLLRLGEPSTLEEFLKEVFDIDLDQYRSWFWRTERHLSRKRYARPPTFPASLRIEEELLQERRIILDVVSHEFGFKLIPAEARPVSGAGLGFRLTESVNLSDALLCLGYAPEDFSSLKVTASDDWGRKFEATVEDIYSSDQGITDIMVTLPKDVIGDKGTLRLIDPGADTVVRSEETLLRELKFSLSDLQPSAARTAWEVVQHICGDERPKKRENQKLWKGAFEAINSELADADALLGEELKDWLLTDTDLPEQSWRAITGAAGTGKTRQTASLVFDHLEAKSARPFPPARVLVVAATHYALDNFMNAFRGLAQDKYVVFRFVPTKRKDELMQRGVISNELFNWSVANGEKVKSELPKPNSERTPETLQEISEQIDKEIAATNALLQRADLHTRLSSFIPSHERWRKSCGLVGNVCDVDQLNARLSFLEVRSEQIRSSVITTPFLPARDFDRTPLGTATDVYTLFASDVLVTTVDAFDRLPDLYFDLVVVEEASQLRILKFLKVFTKVIRARPGYTAPKTLLSGDAQQLPPFVDSFNKIKSELFSYLNPRLFKAVRELNWGRLLELRAAETPFDSLCNRHQDRVARLTTQRRMSPNIAHVVRNLFYSDEDWAFSTKKTGSKRGQIIWMNSTGPTHYLGTSSYNESEVDAVKSLIRWLKASNDDVLVVTPYSAQVTKLRSGLPSRMKVTTIDGCQGIQAPIVIVSFVTFDFSNKHHFVIEPRRMNVALSRASEILCLVGNYQQLIQSLQQADDGAFPHMSGLAEFFNGRGSMPGVVPIGL